MHFNEDHETSVWMMAGVARLCLNLDEISEL